MKILRVDFGVNIGFGHLRRSENLKVKNEKYYIVCIKCDERYTDIPLIKIKDKNQFFEVVKKLKPEEVIVDNYDFTLEDEKKFKKMFPEIRLICFDDFEKQHFCDEVLSLNPCTKHKRIKLNLKKHYFKRDGIMVSIGAVDGKGVIFKILEFLKGDIHIYTTSKNPNLAKLKKIAKLKNAKLHIDEDTKIALFRHKFAILSASTLSIEAMEAKIPFIAIKTAKNQEILAKCLKRKTKVLEIKEIYKLRKLNDLRKRWGIRG